jgi:two-component system response regulator DctR
MIPEKAFPKCRDEKTKPLTAAVQRCGESQKREIRGSLLFFSLFFASPQSMAFGFCGLNGVWGLKANWHQFVHIVDDDEAIRDLLRWMMQSRGTPCRLYPSAESFLEAWDAAFAGCILLDIRMGEMSGNELFGCLIERGCRLPVIFLTGHGNVPLAVSMLKNGAFDFIEKPFNGNALVSRVSEALAFDEAQRQAAASADSVRRRLARLSSREEQVMERILTGKQNRVIADELRISMRIIEEHRANLFRKMGVRTAVQLAQVMGLVRHDRGGQGSGVSEPSTEAVHQTKARF